MSFEVKKCPYCNNECEADWTNTESSLGYEKAGPYICNNCGASEISIYDDLGFDRKLHNEHISKYMKLQLLEDGRMGFKLTKPFTLPEDATISQEEFDIGWFKPGSRLGTGVRRVNGKYVYAI